MSSVAVPVQPQAQPRARAHVDLALGWATLALLWLILWRHLSAEWSFNPQYAYGWFVPFFAAYLFWLRWETRPQAAKFETRSEPDGHFSKFEIAAAISLLLLLPLRVFEIGNPDWRPLSWLHAAIVAGLTYLYIGAIGGRPWRRHFAFPIAFTFIAVPWITPVEEPIVQGLMRTIAAAATETVALLGIPAEVQGNLIRIGNGLVGVNEACSGVRSLQTSIMIGLLFGELKRLSILRRTALVGSAIAVALIANYLRATFLVWIAATRGTAQSQRWHDLAGYAIVAIVFVATMLLAKMLGTANAERSTLNAQRPTQEHSSFACRAVAKRRRVIRHSMPVRLGPFVAAASLSWLLFIEFAAATWYRAHEKNLIATQKWDVRWPESAPGFRDVPIDEAVKSTLRFDEGREVSWLEPNEAETAAPNSIRTLLFFFRWEPSQNSVMLARFHRPDVCLPAAGWRQSADHGARLYRLSPQFALPVRHLEFATPENSFAQKRFANVFFCLWENQISPSASSDERLAAAERATANWSRSERIQVVLQGKRQLGQQAVELIFVTNQPLPPTEAEERFAQMLPRLIEIKREQSK